MRYLNLNILQMTAEELSKVKRKLEKKLKQISALERKVSDGFEMSPEEVCFCIRAQGVVFVRRGVNCCTFHTYLTHLCSHYTKRYTYISGGCILPIFFNLRVIESHSLERTF